MTIHTIGEICNINALSIRKGEHPKQILYLDTANLVEGRICKLQEINFADAPSRAQRKINNDTILYSSVRPNLKHFGIMKSMPSNVIVSTGFITLDVKDKSLFSPEYIYYLLTQQGVVDYLQGIAQNGVSAYPSINPSDIANLKFNFPSLSDQEHIASVLTNIDRKIALNRQINDNLEAMARQLYDYWFVQFDFPDENGKPYKSNGGKMVWNDKLKREIPEGWSVSNIFDALSVQYGFPFSTELFTVDETQKPVVRIRDILNNSVSAYSVEEVDCKYRLQKQDLLIGMDGNFHMNYWNDNLSYLNQRSVRLRAKKNSTVSIVQAKYDIQPYIKAREANSKGSTVGHLSDKDLKDLYVLVPSKGYYKVQFDMILSMIISNRNENVELTKQRDELLPLLMNGQATVNYHLSDD